MQDAWPYSTEGYVVPRHRVILFPGSMTARRTPGRPRIQSMGRAVWWGNKLHCSTRGTWATKHHRPTESWGRKGGQKWRHRPDNKIHRACRGSTEGQPPSPSGRTRHSAAPGSGTPKPRPLSQGRAGAVRTATAAALAQ